MYLAAFSVSERVTLVLLNTIVSSVSGLTIVLVNNPNSSILFMFNSIPVGELKRF